MHFGLILLSTTLLLAASGCGGSGGAVVVQSAGRGGTSPAAPNGAGTAGAGAFPSSAGSSGQPPVSAGGSGTTQSAPACSSWVPLSCPAVDGSKALGALTDADRTTLCGCMAEHFGGYGKGLTCTCTDGTRKSSDGPPSLAICQAGIKTTAACTWTLAEYLTCLDAKQSDPCARTLPTACAPAETSACQFG